jgi:[CysO sulfur-carrier protein]-S-L-cysteine hydrolase
MAAIAAITISNAHWAAMHRHVAAEAPLEACGLVAGQERQSLAVFPVTNELHSPTAYRFAPQEQLDLFLRLEKEGWDLLAIYHSHPTGPQTPSQTDVAQAAYPDSIYLIWSKIDTDWQCRGFIIETGQVTEIPIKISP